MVSPIDLCQISFDSIVPIASSNVNFRELFVNVVEKTSQLRSRLERTARALISSSKYSPYEENLANTRLKVLMWEVVGSDSFNIILNNCRINMSLDEDDFFS